MGKLGTVVGAEGGGKSCRKEALIAFAMLSSLSGVLRTPMFTEISSGAFFFFFFVPEIFQPNIT